MYNNCCFNPQCIIKSMLCNCNCKFPMWNAHYVTGPDILLFSNLACVENTLTKLTCKCNNFFNQCHPNQRRML